MRFHGLIFTCAILFHCASPDNGGGQKEPAAEKDVPGIPIELQEGVSKACEKAVLGSNANKIIFEIFIDT